MKISVKAVESAMEDIRSGRVKPVRMSYACFSESMRAAEMNLVKMGVISIDELTKEHKQGPAEELSDMDVQKIRLDTCPECNHQHPKGKMPGDVKGRIIFRACDNCGSAFAFFESDGILQ